MTSHSISVMCFASNLPNVRWRDKTLKLLTGAKSLRWTDNPQKFKCRVGRSPGKCGTKISAIDRK